MSAFFAGLGRNASGVVLNELLLDWYLWSFMFLISSLAGLRSFFLWASRYTPRLGGVPDLLGVRALLFADNGFLPGLGVNRVPNAKCGVVLALTLPKPPPLLSEPNALEGVFRSRLLTKSSPRPLSIHSSCIGRRSITY